MGRDKLNLSLNLNNRFNYFDSMRLKTGFAAPDVHLRPSTAILPRNAQAFRRRSNEYANKHESQTDEKSQKTLADYLGDLINVESHIEAALDHQKNETKDDPTAGPLVQQFHDMVKTSARRLEGTPNQKGSTAGNPVSKSGPPLLGKVAVRDQPGPHRGRLKSTP